MLYNKNRIKQREVIDMKKTALFFLCIVLAVALIACGKTDNSTPEAPQTDLPSAFQKPSDYAVVLSVRLNPHVNIYLDKNGTVLAIEPLNEDAELIMGELSNITDYQTVVQVFISESYSKGYVKNDAKLFIEVVEQLEEQMDTAVLLETVAGVADDVVREKNIPISIETKLPAELPKPEQSEGAGDTDAPSDIPDSPQTDAPKPDYPTPDNPVPDNPTPTDPTPDVPAPSDPKPNPPTQEQPSGSATQSNAAFLSKFMAVHNAGKRYKFAFEGNEYDVSFNTQTGVCSIIHKERGEYDRIELTREISWYPSFSVESYNTYYYQGSFSINADKTLNMRFSECHFGVEIKGVSSAVIKEVRDFVWSNLYIADWQENWLERGECELWDSLLNGYIVKDTRRFQNVLEVSGNVDLPFDLTYYYYNGEKFRSVEFNPDSIFDYDHYYAGSYEYRKYDLNGHRSIWGSSQSDGAYWRNEYDEQDRMTYMTNHNSDGSYGESIFEYQNGKYTKTTFNYGYDKTVNGLCLKEKVVDVFRDFSQSSSVSDYISSHTYNGNGELIRYSLYNENGQITESLYSDEFGDSRAHTVYTYDGRQLMKEVITRQDSVTTKEYIYENGVLVRMRTTEVYSDGSTHTREDEIFLDKPYLP